MMSSPSDSDLNIELSPVGALEAKAARDDKEKIAPLVRETTVSSTTESLDQWSPPKEWLLRFTDEYSGEHNGETLPPGSDPDRVAVNVFTLSEEQSIEILKETIDTHQQDYTFDKAFMARIKLMVQGNEVNGLEHGEWSYQVCKTAGIVHNWSPYTEVRSVTVPYDDPDEPCETFRAYVLGLFWVCVCTAVNTCETQFPSSSNQS